MNEAQKELIRDQTNRLAHVQIDHDKMVERIGHVHAKVGRALALSKTKLDEARLWALEAAALADLSAG